MNEHLKSNILNFKWPASTPTISLTLDDIEGSHIIDKSKFSKQIHPKMHLHLFLAKA